ncbi:MAG: hypothetical protein D6796_08490 [Caldilineae bacterium]|nr:MAG: hypothetical protein D6796_08490 [Caldilineae bacterium]
MFRKMEAALVRRLRRWYWHFEVERMALHHFYRNAPLPLDAALRLALCTLLTHLIHFFVTDEALFLD